MIKAHTLLTSERVLRLVEFLRKGKVKTIGIKCGEKKFEEVRLTPDDLYLDADATKGKVRIFCLATTTPNGQGQEVLFWSSDASAQYIASTLPDRFKSAAPLRITAMEYPIDMA